MSIVLINFFKNVFDLFLLDWFYPFFIEWQKPEQMVCEIFHKVCSGIYYYLIGYWKTDEMIMKNGEFECLNIWTIIQMMKRVVFKIRIILIFRKILFSGFVRKCHFFTSWFLRFSEKTFQCSNGWKCILSYIENYPMFTKWKRLHFTHQGGGGSSTTFL